MWYAPSFLEVWLRCNTARAWVAPVWIRASVLVAVKGVAPCFAAREGLGVSSIGGGKGRARGPYQFYNIYIYMYVCMIIYYTQEPTELWKKKRFNLQAPPVYDRKVTNLFFSIIIFSIFFFSIILSVTVCPSIRNLNAF